MKRHCTTTMWALVGLSLTGLLATCKQPDPNVPASAATMAMPRVVRVSLTDIPSTNIRIDTVTKTVEITLPEDYSVVSPMLSFSYVCPQCTSGNKTGSKAETMRLGAIGSSNAPPTGSFFIDEQTTAITVRYLYTIRPTGTFSVESTAAPAPAETGEYPGINVRNFLDGQRTESVLTNVETGDQIKAVVGFCKASIGDCTSPRADRIYMGTTSALPGTYDLTLTKADGRRVSVPKAISVVRGTPQVESVYWNVPEGPIQITGINLYDEFKPEITLTNRTGQAVKVAITGYDERKRVATGLATTVAKPGKYTATLSSARGGSIINKKVYVSRYAGQPILDFIDVSYSDGQQQADVRTLALGTTYIASIWKYSAIKKDRLVFTSVATDGASFEVPVLMPAAYYIYGPAGNPTFTLPAGTLSGRYRIAYRVYTTADTYLESEPLDQEFVIR